MEGSSTNCPSPQGRCQQLSTFTGSMDWGTPTPRSEPNCFLAPSPSTFMRTPRHPATNPKSMHATPSCNYQIVTMWGIWSHSARTVCICNIGSSPTWPSSPCPLLQSASCSDCPHLSCPHRPCWPAKQDTRKQPKQLKHHTHTFGCTLELPRSGVLGA